MYEEQDNFRHNNYDSGIAAFAKTTSLQNLLESDLIFTKKYITWKIKKKEKKENMLIVLKFTQVGSRFP